MPLIKAGRAIADSFIHVADGEPLPTDGAIIIGLARWQEERGLIEPRRDPLGVRLKPGDPVEQIAGDLGRLAVVALEFPKFNDGRALSQGPAGANAPAIAARSAPPARWCAICCCSCTAAARRL
jgi:uncharacterized protein (DUF934 family)